MTTPRLTWLFLACGALGACRPPVSRTPATPDPQRDEAARLVAVLSRWDREQPRDLQAVVVRRRGVVVAERYFNGAGSETLHDVRSAGKSVTSLLVGAAIARGYLPGLEDPVARHVPEARARPA